MFKITNPNPGPRGFSVVQTNAEGTEIVSRTKHTVPAGGHIHADIPQDQADKLNGVFGLVFEDAGEAANQEAPGAEVVDQVTAAPKAPAKKPAPKKKAPAKKPQ